MKWLLIATVVLWGATAVAQEPTDSQKAEASARFRRGVELYHEGAYRAALAEFQRAYATAPDYRLLYNIAQAKLEVQDYLGAAQDYERYLNEGGSAIDPSSRDQVADVLVTLRERVGRVRILVNQPGAEIMIDDIKVGVSPISSHVLANAGRHRVSARTKEGASDAKVIDLAGGEAIDVSLELIDPVVLTEQKTRWTVLRKTGFGGWIAGGAMLTTGIVTAVMANNSEKELDRLLETPDVSRKAVADERKKADNLALTTDILLFGGAAVAAVGTLFWVLGGNQEQPRAASARVDWNVGFGTAQVRTHF